MIFIGNLKDNQRLAMIGDLKHINRFRKRDLRILHEIDDTQKIVWIKIIE
jgi:hypothetical protein